MFRSFGIGRTFRPHGACVSQRTAQMICIDHASVMGKPVLNIVSSNASLAATPLSLIEYDQPFFFAESQFVLSEKLNGLFEKLFETECGVWIMHTFAFYTLLRMFSYYFFWQPSVIKHYQDRYAQTWRMGHHLYGSSHKNPLRK
jgi:hypothetical protein